MKRYETPQAAEVGQASELVLGEKLELRDDSQVGGQPANLDVRPSVVDNDD